jgi:hypothetical protein
VEIVASEAIGLLVAVVESTPFSERALALGKVVERLVAELSELRSTGRMFLTGLLPSELQFVAGGVVTKAASGTEAAAAHLIHTSSKPASVSIGSDAQHLTIPAQSLAVIPPGAAFTVDFKDSAALLGKLVRARSIK